MFKKQGNRRIYAHRTEKGDYALIVGGRTDGRDRRDEACTNRLMDSGTGRRTATRLRVDSASFRNFKPSDCTSVLNKGENRVKELRMPNSAVVGAAAYS